jgi:hypothetical protein
MGNKCRTYENSPYRGYLSTTSDIAFFGLGKVATIDSVIVLWPTGKKQLLQDVKANQLLLVDIKNAMDSSGHNKPICVE